MESIYNFLIENKMLIGGGSAGIILFWERILAFLKPFFSKTTVSKPVFTDGEDLELTDQNCLKHLRMRASQLKDAELLKKIKEVDAVFFDIHTGTKDVK